MLFNPAVKPKNRNPVPIDIPELESKGVSVVDEACQEEELQYI